MSARILIADDSPLVQASLKKLLESYSTDWKVCVVAANGRQAIQKAMETQPDLVILDLQMPLMDGLTAASVIGRYLPKVPLLMYTVYKSLELDANARMVGVREVVSKSDPGALLKAVAKLLGQKQKKALGRPV